MILVKRDELRSQKGTITTGSMGNQLVIFSNGEAIETVHIAPTKDMPIEVFRECYRISYFMQLMQELPDGKRLWDEIVSDIWAENLPDVMYSMVKDGILEMTFEMPKKIIDEWSKS